MTSLDIYASGLNHHLISYHLISKITTYYNLTSWEDRYTTNKNLNTSQTSWHPLSNIANSESLEEARLPILYIVGGLAEGVTILIMSYSHICYCD